MFTYLQGKLRRRTRARNEATEAGFTLIELLVSIVILGILASIVVFSVRGINDKGQTAACRTDKSTIQTAEEAYFATDSRNKYADIDTLEKDGFLSTKSAWYEVTVVATPPSYSITPKVIAGQTNPCSGI
ncbi:MULTISPECIES: type IV pilin protein [unclassified Streptomyces]|uniref:type IV pilin protein n=1 Tax=unclassified Streptomyces TaxID=2593676 RepID=UPI0007C4A5F9|nr:MULTISPECIES: prepilin-type N-terminal cleavage/methylation domain-containing protein [unclassified Streptomyces]